MKRLLSVVFMCLVLSAVASAKDVLVSSPDGSLTVTVGVDGGKAWYRVACGGETVIGRSALGFVLKDGDLKDNFKMGKVTRASLDETWSQPWGEDAQVRNHYNEMKVMLQEKNGQQRQLGVCRILPKYIACPVKSGKYRRRDFQVICICFRFSGRSFSRFSASCNQHKHQNSYK